MKYSITILFVLFSLVCFSQPISTQYLGAPNTEIFVRGWLRADSGFLSPINDTILSPLRVGEMRFRTEDSSLYIAQSTVADIKWVKSGSGGGVTIYTGDGSLSGPRTISLNGNLFKFYDGTNDLFEINPVGHIANIEANDGTAHAHVSFEANTGNDVTFHLEANNGSGSPAIINGDGIAGTINYTADTHTFNGKSFIASSTGAAGSNYGSQLQASNPTGLGNGTTILADAGDADAKFSFLASFNDGATSASIIGQAQSGTSSVAYTADTHTFNGLLTLSSYGGGTHTGTPTFGLSIDASGNIIETSDGATLTISSPLTGTSYNGSSPVSIGIQNSAADGSTKGAAAFNSTYFDASSGVITIDATNGLATSGQSGYLSSTDWNTFNNNYITAVQSLGSKILAFPLGTTWSNTLAEQNMVDGTAYYISFYLPKAVTITGLSTWMRLQGNYTADNFNGVALYSVDTATGTLTQVAISANDGNFWKATTNSMIRIPFTSPYPASSGVYWAVMIYNSSSQVTAPKVMSMSNDGSAPMGLDFVHSIKFYGITTSTNTLPTPTIASSSISADNVQYFLMPYQ